MMIQAPVHTDALTIHKSELKIHKTEDGKDIHKRRIVAESVVEQRVSHFLMELAHGRRRDFRVSWLYVAYASLL